MNTPYVQTFGSFIRNSNYPLEADYIFDSEESLKEWEEANRKYLHEGLFKVVISEDLLTLYWYNDDTFTPLITSKSLEHIAYILKDFELHGQLRDLLRDLQNATKSKLNALQQELDETQAGSGLNGDGSFDLLSMKNTTYLDGSTSIIEAIKALDREISNLVVDAFILNAYYDSSDEALVIVFLTKQEKEKTLRIPLTNLIREWEPDNTHPSKVVELSREEVYGNGADKLSADVRLSSNRHNILLKDGNTLLVEGISDNIIYEGDVTVKSKLDTLSEVTDSSITLINTLNQKLNEEISRASSSEDSLSERINAIKTSLDNNFNNDEVIKGVVEELKLADNTILNKLDSEITRATDSELLLDHKIEDLLKELDSNYTLIAKNIEAIDQLKLDNVTQDSNIQSLDTKVLLIKDTIETNINTLISGLSLTLSQEIIRSTQEDVNIKNDLLELTSSLNAEIIRASLKEDFIDSRIDDHINDHNNPHQVSAEQINVYTKDAVNSIVSDLNTKHTSTTDTLKDSLILLDRDFNDHLIDYGNPHKVTKAQVGLDKVDNTTDLEKPISVATLEALHNLDLKIAEKADENDLLDHIFDHNNPHNVTKELIGLGNVDNTSDLYKPISLATLMALDKKSDIGHTHTMSDITDLENTPIIKGFVELLSDLPETAAGGTKYILITQVGSGITRYTLCEFDGGNGTWKLKLLTTGGIAAVIGGDLWKLNSDGIERVLDRSDYRYFYDKIYLETKNLIEDIDWEEDDANSDTNHLIRLKITYKTSYGDPNEPEALNPFSAKATKYIDIEKSRFLSDAYSRPARQSDVDDGYATKIGEPLLILVMTTGDYVTISLKDSLNIYDAIDTDSIEMSVTDWTGDPSDSYKVSAIIRIALTEDKNTAVSLHVKNGAEKGLYTTLHTSNTNSISLNPSTGPNGSLKTLTADLNIDNSINENSDILLTISSSGLSARLVWGEYE